MKLIATKDLKNNVYNVQLKVIDVTDTDKEKFSDFGEFTVDVGGKITGAGTKVEYTQIQVPKTETVQEDLVINGEEIKNGAGEVVQVPVEKPVLDGENNPVLEDLQVDGEPAYQITEVPTEETIGDLGTQLKKFPSDFPVTVSFPASVYGEGVQEIVEHYITGIHTKIQAELDAFEAKEDTFSGVETIPFEKAPTPPPPVPAPIAVAEAAPVEVLSPETVVTAVPVEAAPVEAAPEAVEEAPEVAPEAVEGE